MTATTQAASVDYGAPRQCAEAALGTVGVVKQLVRFLEHPLCGALFPGTAIVYCRRDDG